MACRLNFRASLLCVTALAAACSGDSTAPAQGDLNLTVITSGVDLDPNGYLASIDGGAPTTAPANGTAALTGIAAGEHTLSVTDVDENCSLTETTPVGFTVTDGSQTSVVLHITCTYANTLAYIQGDTVYLTSMTAGFTPRPIGHGYKQLNWSPDGSTLALLDGHAVYLANADGGNIRLLHDFGSSCFSCPTGVAVWSPDGSWLLVEWFTIMHAVGLVRLSPSAGDEFSFPGADPSWSPDGHHVAVNGVALYSADGVFELALPSGGQPRWSPDGSRIAFVHTEFDGTLVHVTIHTIRPDGTDDRDLTTPYSSIHRDQSPSWSPDGRQLAFLIPSGEGDAVTWDIWIMNADGGDRRKLAPGTFAGWSRDGSRLAFLQPTGELALIRPDGTGLTPVTPVGSQVSSVGWRP